MSAVSLVKEVLLMVQLVWSSVAVVLLMVISPVVLLMVISSGAAVGVFEQSPERKLHIITSHDK